MELKRTKENRVKGTERGLGLPGALRETTSDEVEEGQGASRKRE